MKKIILATVITLISVSASAFNVGEQGGPILGSVFSTAAGSVASTYASGSVTQDANIGNYVTSGAQVVSSSTASVDTHVRDSGAETSSWTMGVAGGNGNAAYLGGSEANAVVFTIGFHPLW
ncbi:MAG: hypothetical protein ACXW2E_01940 [Nitrososphaeraceae archaeon]